MMDDEIGINLYRKMKKKDKISTILTLKLMT